MTSITNKFTGTSFILIIGKILSISSGIIFARYLGAEQYGAYGFIISFMSLMAFPILTGLPILVVREIARSKINERWEEIYGLIRWSNTYIIIMSVIIVSILMVLNYFQNIFKDMQGLITIGLFLIPLKGILIQQNAIINAFKKPTLSQLSSNIILPLIIITCLLFYIMADIKISANKLLQITVFATFIACIVSFIFKNKTLGKVITSEKSYNHREWRSILFSFTIIVLVNQLNMELGSVLLGIMKDNENVAYFKVAIQAMGLVSILLTSMSTVLMPEVADLYKKNEILIAQGLITRSVRLISLFSLPIIMILFFFGELIIELMFGIEYLSAYKIILILCVGQIVNILMGPVGMILNMTGNEKLTMKASLKMLLLTLVSMPIAVYYYGEYGAAVVVSLVMIIFNILRAIDLKKITKLETWLK